MTEADSKLPPRRRLADPATASVVSESDLDIAIRQFNADVPPQYRGLLEAETVDSDEPERI